MNFYRLQNHTKIVRLRVNFKPIAQLAHFSQLEHLPSWASQLALPATGTFRRIFLFYWEIECPNCRFTLYFVFVLFDIADLRKVVLIEHFFYFWKVLVLRKDILYILLFFQKFVRYQKKFIKFFAWKLYFVKILSLIRASLIRAQYCIRIGRTLEFFEKILSYGFYRINKPRVFSIWAFFFGFFV